MVLSEEETRPSQSDERRSTRRSEIPQDLFDDDNLPLDEGEESTIEESEASSRSQLPVARTGLSNEVHETRSELILKEKTPWMQDLELQVERILAILEKAIVKLKIMALLPKLVDFDGEDLAKYLSREDTNFVCRVCKRYLMASQKSVSLIDRLVLPYLKEKKEKVDPQMTNALAKLYKSETLRGQINTLRDYPNEQTLVLITYLQKLKDTIKLKLNVSAEEEQQRELELQRAYNANILCRAEIDKLEELIEKQREDLGDQLNAKEELIEQYKEKIEKIQEKFQENMMVRIKESEKQMVKDSLASEIRKAELSVEAKTTSQRYEQILEQHLIDEKNMRAKRSKVETQLASWLAKFDSDIGDRNTEFEQVKAEYDEEKATYDALQEKMDEQDVEYVILMREREEEEMRLFEIKALVFLQNRSARLIQRTWKKYLERKEARKKKRKARAKRAAAKLAKKLAGAVAATKKGKKGAKGAKPAKKHVVVVEDEPEIPPEGEIPVTKEGEMPGEGEVPREGEIPGEGEGEGEGKEGKPKKEKKKGKGKGKGKGKKIRKGEKPKSKKDIKITKESDAVAMLESAFGGQLEDFDTTTEFTKDEVNVDLAEL